MYLSRLRIKNYRSIKEIDVDFRKGKNIIVGKNNSGKSNIIKAIDILLGESSPTYHKLDNITQSDFHNNSEDSILMFCTLEREDGEELCYDEMYKCFGFKKHVEGYHSHEFRHKISPNLSYFWQDLEAAMDVSDEDNNTKTFYVSPKIKEQKKFENEFDDKFLFAFAFRASFTNNSRIHKELRFFYKESKNADWIMAFSAPIRNEFIQSAIIPSFRDPSSQLRINQWTWFGKLLKNNIDSNNSSLINAFDQVRSASEGVFRDLKTHINNSKVKVAFPDTSISFQFNPESKIDFYKNALIYVDDGYNSLLQDKGSGIQSAVIIGLFHYYTNNIAHLSCSLLAIEEPELYLHPQARRVISNRIDDFLNGNKNQVIITTHSTEFISSAHENLNIVLVSKNNSEGTVTKNTSFKDSKEKQLLVKVQNAEMFFADKVLLVEGGEKYILESVAKYYGEFIRPDLGVNWLNDKNCSIIAVSGKTEFWKYHKKLNELGIAVFIMADFDFLLRKLSEFYTYIGSKKETCDELNSLKSKINANDPVLTEDIIIEMNKFEVFLQEKGYSFDKKEIRSKIKEVVKIKRMSQFSEEKQVEIRKYIEKIKSNNIFILEGELEDYYNETCKNLTKGINGKEEKPIYIVSSLLDNSKINDLINIDEYIKFLDLISNEYDKSMQKNVELYDEVDSNNQIVVEN